MDFSDDKKRKKGRDNDGDGCLNTVHSEVRPFTKYCSSCGVLVNSRVDSGSCNEVSHARKKTAGESEFCADCGVHFL